MKPLHQKGGLYSLKSLYKVYQLFNFHDLCFQPIISYLRASPFIIVSLITAIFVWSMWLLLLGPSNAIANSIEHWQIILTMFFGSIVAGGTSMGGGAVAFPVMTKVLEIPAHEAKVFSLAIQTVGMGAASLTILAMKTQLQWRLIRWTSVGGILGIWLGSTTLAPILPPDIIRFSFTMMIASFAIVLIVINRDRTPRNMQIVSWGRRERVISLCLGAIGGVVSSLVGSGMDICAFSVMVILFNLCEKVSTPTSVVLMAINAAAGLFCHAFLIRDFIDPIQSYWQAAIPIVVVGAPAGAMICSKLSRQMIVGILLVLIGLEFSSSLLLIPLNESLIALGIGAFLLFSIAYYWMYRIKLT